MYSFTVLSPNKDARNHPALTSSIDMQAIQGCVVHSLSDEALLTLWNGTAVVKDNDHDNNFPVRRAWIRVNAQTARELANSLNRIAEDLEANERSTQS